MTDQNPKSCTGDCDSCPKWDSLAPVGYDGKSDKPEHAAFADDLWRWWLYDMDPAPAAVEPDPAPSGPTRAEWRKEW